MNALTRWRLNVPEVHRVIHAQRSMLDDWAETLPDSPERGALWTELHQAGDALGDMVYGGPSLSARWRYWIRPYDDLADQRRWRWQPRQRCGLNGVPPETRAALLDAVRRDLLHQRLQVVGPDRVRRPEPPRLVAGVELVRRGVRVRERVRAGEVAGPVGRGTAGRRRAGGLPMTLRAARASALLAAGAFGALLSVVNLLYAITLALAASPLAALWHTWTAVVGALLAGWARRTFSNRRGPDLP